MRLVYETTGLRLGPCEELQMFQLPAVPPDSKPGKFDEKHSVNLAFYVNTIRGPGVPLKGCVDRMMSLAYASLIFPSWYYTHTYQERSGDANYQFWVPLIHWEAITTTGNTLADMR